jgi:hypothetical protein
MQMLYKQSNASSQKNWATKGTWNQSNIISIPIINSKQQHKNQQTMYNQTIMCIAQSSSEPSTLQHKQVSTQ